MPMRPFRVMEPPDHKPFNTLTRRSVLLLKAIKFGLPRELTHLVVLLLAEQLGLIQLVISNFMVASKETKQRLRKGIRRYIG